MTELAERGTPHRPPSRFRDTARAATERFPESGFHAAAMAAEARGDNACDLTVLAKLEKRLATASEIDLANAAPCEEALADVPAWVRDRLDAIPLPGQGETLTRWRALAAVGAYDLSAAKLYESHTDALAILAELAPGMTPPSGLGAVWAAEHGADKLVIDGDLRLRGRKYWCSGAHLADWALVTAWPARESDAAAPRRLLALVALQASNVTHDLTHWHAVGMADTRTATVTFRDTAATVIGGPDDYLDRPGFWHGGTGIAAVWYGAACAIGARLARSTADDAYKAMHLGAIDGMLSSTRAVLREAARHIDTHPHASSECWALRARTVTDDATRRILDHTSRALGPGPICQEAALAKRFADLPVFLRQVHAEKDLAALGAHLSHAECQGAMPWRL